MPSVERPPAMLMYFRDFTSDSKVEVMTNEEVGAYFLLLAIAWFETPPASLPDNDALLSRWARATASRWTEIKPVVMSPFVLRKDGRWHQPRMRHEFDKLMKQRLLRVEAGKVGAHSRWQSHANANGKRNAVAMRSHSNQTEDQDQDQSTIHAGGRDLSEAYLNSAGIDTQSTQDELVAKGITPADVLLHLRDCLKARGVENVTGLLISKLRNHNGAFADTVISTQTVLDWCKRDLLKSIKGHEINGVTRVRYNNQGVTIDGRSIGSVSQADLLFRPPPSSLLEEKR